MARKTPRRKVETVHTLRGILGQVRFAINTSDDGATITMPLGVGLRIENALVQMIRSESILTEPPKETI